jgi:hypothetical protein
MKMYSLVLFAVAFATTAVASNVNLGCDVRGPLYQLMSSVEFREAIGDSNPANYLAQVFDSKGIYLTPATTRALQCPLYVSSDAEPSASASQAILDAGTLQAEKTKAKPASSATEEKSVKVFSSRGEIARIAQPAYQQKELAVASNHEAIKASKAEVSENKQLKSEAAKPRQESVACVTPPDPAKADPDPPVSRIEGNPASSFLESIHWIKKEIKAEIVPSNSAMRAQDMIVNVLPNEVEGFYKFSRWQQACPDDLKNYKELAMGKYLASSGDCNKARETYIVRSEYWEPNIFMALFQTAGLLLFGLAVCLIAYHQSLVEWSEKHRSYYGYDNNLAAWHHNLVEFILTARDWINDKAPRTEPPSSE